MAVVKISQLPAASAVIATDLVPMVDDPSGTPVTQKATWTLVRDYILSVSGGTATISENLAVGGTLAVTGVVTGGTYNGQTISSAASFTGTLAVASTVTGGTYNGQTISSSANFTGTMAIATTLTTSGTTASLVQSATSGLVNVGTGTGSSLSGVVVRRASGQEGYLQVETGTTRRWRLGANSTSETGSNAGSNFVLAAYDDVGTLIDIPFAITRVASGSVSFVRNITQTADTANLAQSTTGAIVAIGSGTGSSTSLLAVRAAAGQLAYTVYRSSNSDRWIIGRNSNAESGSNAGSSFILSAYDDSGVFIDTPLTIARASGSQITLTRPLVLSGGSANPAVAITTTGAVNASYRYDASNRLDIAVSSAGAVTYDATGASAGHSFSEAVTVAAGGIAVTGNSTVTGTVGVVGGSSSNAFVVTTTGAIQESIRYDSSNRMDVSVSSAGAVTFDAVGASSAFTLSDVVTVSPAAVATSNGALTITSPAGTTGTKGLQINHSPSTALNFDGIEAAVTTTHTSGTATIIGAESSILVNGAGGTSDIIGFTSSLTRSAGTVSNYRGFSVSATATVTDWRGVNITTNAGAGAGTYYGVYIGAIASSGTNYALYTNGGQVRLGDIVAVNGATPSTTTALITSAGTTGVSSLRVPHGAAPTTPVDGDIWTTTAGLFVRINGATVGPLT